MIFLFTSVNFQKQMMYSGSSIMRKIITGNTLYLLCTLLEDGNWQGLFFSRIRRRTAYHCINSREKESYRDPNTHTHTHPLTD